MWCAAAVRRSANPIRPATVAQVCQPAVLALPNRSRKQREMPPTNHPPLGLRTTSDRIVSRRLLIFASLRARRPKTGKTHLETKASLHQVTENMRSQSLAIRISQRSHHNGLTTVGILVCINDHRARSYIHRKPKNSSRLSIPESASACINLYGVVVAHQANIVNGTKSSRKGQSPGYDGSCCRASVVHRRLAYRPARRQSGLAAYICRGRRRPLLRLRQLGLSVVESIGGSFHPRAGHTFIMLSLTSSRHHVSRSPGED